MLLGAKFRKKYCIADDFREEFALQQENIWLMTRIINVTRWWN